MAQNASENAVAEEEAAPRPPLPPRPGTLSFMQETAGSGPQSRPSTRAGLVSGATTALSMTDVNAHTRSSGKDETRNVPTPKYSTPAASKSASRATSEVAEDSSSIHSVSIAAPQAHEDEALFDDMLGTRPSQDFVISDSQGFSDESTQLFRDEVVLDFESEFAPLREVEGEAAVDENAALSHWKSKKKHFLILSAAGKPIYTRHGSDAIISTYVGIVQTLISTFSSWNDQLKSFSAGGTKFVILSQANLFLVAISCLPESETQLRLQLEAFYMQILSTLTLPTLTRLFSDRPSTDLRRPLQGTEVLLSALADSFTRGSPSTLLSALESLRMRKAHRKVINDTIVKARVDDLLYGLIVAGGRLVSVIRPKRHSLHPGDLHLIFNMLFEAEGIKAGGGDSFLPICLPGFNNTGYLYMYVSFLDMGGEAIRELDEEEKIAKEDAVAITLLSVNKESFEDLRSMKQYLIHELRKNGGMQNIHNAVRVGRLAPTDIVPGTALRHFLYKSKGNVQYFMPALSPDLDSANGRRQLFSLYQTLHASVHTRHAPVKVQHIVSTTASALAWVTPMFELYCVASSSTARNALAQNANKVIQWIQKEEERIFLIGGAVF